MSMRTLTESIRGLLDEATLMIAKQGDNLEPGVAVRYGRTKKDAVEGYFVGVTEDGRPVVYADGVALVLSPKHRILFKGRKVIRTDAKPIMRAVRKLKYKTRQDTRGRKAMGKFEPEAFVLGGVDVEPEIGGPAEPEDEPPEPRGATERSTRARRGSEVPERDTDAPEGGSVSRRGGEPATDTPAGEVPDAYRAREVDTAIQDEGPGQAVLDKIDKTSKMAGGEWRSGASIPAHAREHGGMATVRYFESMATGSGTNVRSASAELSRMMRRYGFRMEDSDQISTETGEVMKSEWRADGLVAHSDVIMLPPGYGKDQEVHTFVWVHEA